MDHKSTEMARVMALVIGINSRFAAEADARCDWGKRQIEIDIIEGGRTVYHQIIELDGEECKAKVEQTRRDLEHLIVCSELPPVTLEQAV